MILTDSSFICNEGTSHSIGGGGVACFISSVISTTSCNFLNNSANYHGGVFTIWFSSIRFEDSNFYNNFALENGGVIYSNTDFQNPSIIFRSSFIQNRAEINGGVLFLVTAGEQLNITQSTFCNNSANSSGAIIHVSESRIHISETNIFNNAANFGETVHACDSVVTFPGSQFTISTDSSNCTLYGESTDNFRNVSCTVIDVPFDPVLTPFSVTCPFNDDIVSMIL